MANTKFTTPGGGPSGAPPPPGTPNPNGSVTINGVTYFPDPQTPGLYISPWGQRGYLQTEPGSIWNGGASTQSFSPVPDRYFDGGAGGGPSYPPAHADPRYWDLQYQELDQNQRQHVDDLEQRYRGMGMDAETARRAALSQLIQSRNQLSGQIAQTSADVAKTAADFAANPRDAVAELMYRNQTEGGDFGNAFSNPHFPEYQTALQNKGAQLFQNVQGDLQNARNFAMSPPPLEYLGAEQRGQLGLPPLPQQALAGAAAPAAAAPAPAPAAGTNPFAGANQAQLNALRVMAEAPNDPRGQAGYGADLAKLAINAGEVSQPQQSVQPRRYEEGGTIDIGKEMPFAASSEGGTNMNIHERSFVVGESGRIYAQLAEEDPEQLIIKPLPSVMKKKREQEQRAKQGMKAFAEGGTITARPDPSDFVKQLRTQIMRLGGPHGGTGQFEPQTPLADPRLLAGQPANRLEDDPDLMAMTQAGYSSFGISPNNLLSTIKKYTPQGIRNNLPRLNFA